MDNFKPNPFTRYCVLLGGGLGWGGVVGVGQEECADQETGQGEVEEGLHTLPPPPATQQGEGGHRGEYKRRCVGGMI